MTVPTMQPGAMPDDVDIPVDPDLGEGDPLFELTADAVASLREAGRVRWRGWLAPLDKRAGDLREGVPMPTAGTLKHREFPMPFFWQKETSHGGQVINGAREIGTVVYADIRPHPDRNHEPWLWGTGFIDLNDDDGLDYARRLDDGMSRWISVKLDFDPEFEPPAELLNLKDEDGHPYHPGPTDHRDWWRLMNVTAEAQPAFDGAVIELADDLDAWLAGDPDADPVPGEPVGEDCPEGQSCAPSLRPLLSADGSGVHTVNDTAYSTAAAIVADLSPPRGRTGPASGGSGPAGSEGGIAGDHGRGDALVAVVTGDTSLPIAKRDTKWNGDEATARLIEWAGGRFKLDPAAMAKVFLYRDAKGSPKFAAAWKFPIADVIGGRVQIVPAAVFAAAAVLRGARGGTKIPSGDQQAMRGKINTIYRRMRELFKDDKIRSPFEAAIHDDAKSAPDRNDGKGRTQPPWRKGAGRKSRGSRKASLTASAGSWAAMVAAAVPDEPPAEWFTDPKLQRPSKIRVSDEGRVFGHVAAWASTHAALPDVHPPRNRDRSYSKFHRHPVRTAGGQIVKTGPLATGGHTSTEVALPIEQVQAHYDDPRYVVADVICGEDAHGIWVSGALRPGVSAFQVMLLDRYSISGDWRRGELLAACSVSVPGFHLDADTEYASLTASACNSGVVDLPVVGEAAPAVVHDDSGTPVVLVAAGVVVDDHDGDELTDAIDGLGNWLSEELAALRQEFGMATGPRTEQVIAQLRDLVLGELTALRAEFGLGGGQSADTSRTDTATTTTDGAQPTGTTTTTSTTETSPAGSGDAASAPGTGGGPADGTGPDTPTPPATDGAATDGTSTDGGTDGAATDGTATATPPADPVAEFKSWLTDEFATLRAEHAAAAAPADPPPAAADTAAQAPAHAPAAGGGDTFAELSALAAQVHGADERQALAAAVHTGGA